MKPSVARELTAALRSGRFIEVKSGKPGEFPDHYDGRPTCVGGVFYSLYQNAIAPIPKGRKSNVAVLFRDRSANILEWAGMTDREMNDFANWTEFHFYRKRNFKHIADLIEKKYGPF